MSVDGGQVARLLAATPDELGAINPSRYRVYIRDRQLRRLDELSQWQTCTAISRFNEVGSFILEVSREDYLATKLIKGGGIIIKRDDGPGNDLVTVFSGRIEGEYKRTARTLWIKGPDDNVYLRAPARPTPYLAFPPYPDEYDVYTATHVSTAMRRLVDVNIGPSAPIRHQVFGLVLGTDPMLGAPITTHARLNRLIDYLSDMAASPNGGNLGFRIRQSDTVAGVLEFQIYQPVDRRTEAVFSVERGTIKDFEDTWTAPAATRLLVAGQGLGAARKIIEIEDPIAADDLGRDLTLFVDARDATDAELPQRAAEKMAGAAGSRRVSFVPLEVPALREGTHWNLGDIGAFSLRDPVTTGMSTFVDIIREAQYNLKPEEGPEVTPVLGQNNSIGSTPDEKTAQRIESQENRLSNIERNWNIPNDSITIDMLTQVLKPLFTQVKFLAVGTIPPYHLLCDGREVSRTKFALLYSMVGDLYGPGNGTTTFNLPNCIGRVIIGAGGGFPLGSYGGEYRADIDHKHPQIHHHGVENIEIEHKHGPGDLEFPHDHDSGDLQFPHDHTGAQHDHGEHNHDDGDLAFPHTHPGTHTHPGEHSHGDAHDHRYDLNHDHQVFNSGIADTHETINNGTSITTFVVDKAGSVHPVNVPAYGTDFHRTDDQTPTTTDPDGNQGTFASSATDVGSATGVAPSGHTGLSGVPAANFGTNKTGSAIDIVPGGTTGPEIPGVNSGQTGVVEDAVATNTTTTNDETANAAEWAAGSDVVSDEVSIVQPYIALTPVIFCGVLDD